MKTKIIRKHYKTLKQAENYHGILLNKYYCVLLIEFPRSTEEGIYAWQVTPYPSTIPAKEVEKTKKAGEKHG